jgi:hypothetical protein
MLEQEEEEEEYRREEEREAMSNLEAGASAQP